MRINFILDENNQLKKYINGNINYTVENVDKYVFDSLLSDLEQNHDEKYYYYFLNKNLKFNLYDTDLFIINKKNYWKQLIISILSSKAIFETMKSAFNEESENLNLLRDQTFISNIIDKVRFFVYDTNIAGCLNEHSFRIYEYASFLKNQIKSLSFLFFYSFNTITNIHEINGHLYISYNKAHNKKKNKIVDSPEIKKPDYHLYSNYAKGRRKESGELIEITLFGKRIRSLTIKEALFILEPLNYIRGKEFFKNNFIKCNDKKVNDIISPMTKENLKSLDIIVIFYLIYELWIHIISDSRFFHKLNKY